MGSMPIAVAPTLVTLWTQRSSSVLAAPAASVSFTGLSDKVYRLSAAFAVTGALNLRIRLNNDSGANYDQQNASVQNSFTAARSTGNTYWQGNWSGSIPTGEQCAISYLISKPLAAQHAHCVGLLVDGNTTSYMEEGNVTANRWTNTAALVTRVDLLTSTSTFITGSVFTIAGIA